MTLVRAVSFKWWVRLQWVKECIREAEMKRAVNSFRNVGYSGEQRNESTAKGEYEVKE